MASYFDSGEAFDLALLHPDVQTHTDLARTINKVEKDIVRQLRKQDRVTRRSRIEIGDAEALHDVYTYTENGLSYTVYLIGYEPVAADSAGYSATRSAWTGFAEAMRQTIADVVSHRLLHYDDDSDVKSESHGRESWTYAQRDTSWPRNWDASLHDYIPARNDPRTVFSL